VTWTKLLANKDAQKHKTSKKELDNSWALIARDLADAGLEPLPGARSRVAFGWSSFSAQDWPTALAVSGNPGC
jgi:hypothetical protein